jgi:hypothetical protein
MEIVVQTQNLKSLLRLLGHRYHYVQFAICFCGNMNSLLIRRAAAVLTPSQRI